jgi:hypothetical protein
MANWFDRCPSCRKVLRGFAVYRCATCGSMFCGGCDYEDRPEATLEWLEAAFREADLCSCPICTAAIEVCDTIGVIGNPGTNEGVV